MWLRHATQPTLGPLHALCTPCLRRVCAREQAQLPQVFLVELPPVPSACVHAVSLEPHLETLRVPARALWPLAHNHSGPGRRLTLSTIQGVDRSSMMMRA